MACFVYCLLGTSKDVNLGPAAVMSLLTAEFGHSVIHDDATYAIALSLVCGVFQIIMGILQVGRSSALSSVLPNSFWGDGTCFLQWGSKEQLFGLYMHILFLSGVWDQHARSPPQYFCCSEMRGRWCGMIKRLIGYISASSAGVKLMTLTNDVGRWSCNKQIWWVMRPHWT